MFGFGLPELIILLVLFAIPVLWIIALIDVIKSEFTGNNKIIWLLLVVLIPFLGSILYLIFGKKQKIKATSLNYTNTQNICSCGANIQSSV